MQVLSPFSLLRKTENQRMWSLRRLVLFLLCKTVTFVETNCVEMCMIGLAQIVGKCVKIWSLTCQREKSWNIDKWS